MTADLPLWIQIAIKVLIAASVVVTASVMAEKSGPFVGGLILALPVSVGPAYALLALQASPAFVAQSGIGKLYSGESTAVARYFGNGHSENDLRPEFRKRDVPLGWFGTTAERLPEYTQRMQAAYGDAEARRIMIDGTPHIMIYPNLFIAEIQLFVIQPLAVDETVQHVTALQFKGAPDLNRRLRQQTMGSVGPAGFLLADDAAMYERTQLGVQSSNPEWLFVGRGRHRERHDERGYLIGDATDETPTRGIWRHYRSLMETAEAA